ncbi:MAG: hypothetical protein GEEBNDBF_00586 [bacterium]|nr:hypothetical protein [bacterium]
MRHRPTRPYQTTVLIAVFISLLSASVLYARPANRINSTEVNPREIVDGGLDFIVSNPSPFQPVALCQQCHVRQADEWSTSYHYLAWRDPVFQAFYAEYLDYLSPEGQPNRLPASIYQRNSGADLVKDRKSKRVLDGTEMTVVEEEARIHSETQDYAAYQGKRPKAKTPENDSAYERELASKRSIVTKLEPIAEITHGEGLMATGIVDGKVMMNCLKCHAPGADITLDHNMKLENSTSGVFCDYCHTIVDRTDADGYVLSPSHIKQGPFLTGLTASHAMEFSRLHTQSEFCKSCHQQANPLGVNVYNAYNEWFKSPYAQSINQVSCQSCHMEAMPGKSALQGDTREVVYSHKFQGAHDRAYLYQAATVDMDLNVSGSDLLVDCTVTNVKAGHNFPTDSPLRELILVVRLKGPNGETLWQGKRVYSRVWGDIDGNVTYNNWEAAQVLADTSLRAKEARKESFQVPLPSVDGQMYVTAQLFFRTLPEGVSFKGIENVPDPFRIDHTTEFLP